MNYKLKYFMSALLAAGALASCSKMKDIGILNTGNYSDTSGTLKAANSLPIGFAAYMGDKGFSQYFPIIAKEGATLTPGNEMKHGSVVLNDGTLNFTKADALYNQATTAGLKVYGHTLMWHSQQNTTYLSTIAGGGGPQFTNYLTNGGFENGLTGWAAYNSNGATFTTGIASESRSGSGSLKVMNPTAQSNWKVQYASPNATGLTAGRTYTIIVYAKTVSGAGFIQIESRTASTGYSGDQPVSSTWAPIMLDFVASGTTAFLTLDLGTAANTYLIDDVMVVDKQEYNNAIANASGPAVAARVDSVLKLWIVGDATRDGIVKHYAGKVYAWDVANEVLSDAGKLRTSQNTTIPSGGTGYFFWGDYLGVNGVVNAFKYAKQADPNAKLFINDYNLEASKAKTDSLVSLVTYIKANGGQVDGIGTQMHCDALTTTYSGIDYMFQQLAATGLQVRISELDVTTRPSALDATIGDPQTLGYQASMYNYIINSYLKYVPAAQRFGVTIWGVDDADSWRPSGVPLLWDKNFSKKPAYSAVMQALKAGGK